MVNLDAYDIKYRIISDPPSEESLKMLSEYIGMSVFSDYISVVSHFNGIEGYINDNYFELWRVSDVVRFNEEYQVRQCAPGIILFGSNGGGEAYGFDIYAERAPVVRLPLIGMSREDAIFVCAEFANFFDAVANGN